MLRAAAAAAAAGRLDSSPAPSPALFTKCTIYSHLLDRVADAAEYRNVACVVDAMQSCSQSLLSAALYLSRSITQRNDATLRGGPVL